MKHFVAYASKLRGLLNYYLESRNVNDFDRLCELLVCDRINTTLSENCLKYILCIKTTDWPTVKQLLLYIKRPLRVFVWFVSQAQTS